jgi:hypothetical protein
MIDRLQPYWPDGYALGQTARMPTPGGIIMVRRWAIRMASRPLRPSCGVRSPCSAWMSWRWPEFEGYERPREIEQEGPLTRAAQMGTLIAREASSAPSRPQYRLSTTPPIPIATGDVRRGRRYTHAAVI